MRFWRIFPKNDFGLLSDPNFFKETTSVLGLTKARYIVAQSIDFNLVMFYEWCKKRNHDEILIIK